MTQEKKTLKNTDKETRSELDKFTGIFTNPVLREHKRLFGPNAKIEVSQIKLQGGTPDDVAMSMRPRAEGHGKDINLKFEDEVTKRALKKRGK